MGGAVSTLIGLLFMVVLVVTLFRKRKLRGRIGPGASGAVYELLNEDKRNAIELIVEERTGERDPEDKDGDLPQLEKPKL